MGRGFNAHQLPRYIPTSTLQQHGGTSAGTMHSEQAVAMHALTFADIWRLRYGGVGGGHRMYVDLFARLLLWAPQAPPNLEYFREFMMRPTFLGSREGKLLLLLSR